MSNEYWAKRVLENEAKAIRYADSASQRVASLYRSTYREISKAIDDLGLELMNQGAYGKLTRSQLWQYAKYTQLQDKIGGKLGQVAAKQLTIADDALRKVFEKTMGNTLKDLGVKDISYNVLNEFQVKQVLNTAWSGKHYSARIYETSDKIAQRVKKDITDLVIQGKNTELIKKQLMGDLDIGYSYADRLIRTEANHVFNEAAKASYKEAGVTQIEFIPENDSELCDECSGYADSPIYDMDSEPRLPVHPNCRCCYAPVVDLIKE